MNFGLRHRWFIHSFIHIFFTPRLVFFLPTCPFFLCVNASFWKVLCRYTSFSETFTTYFRRHYHEICALVHSSDFCRLQFFRFCTRDGNRVSLLQKQQCCFFQLHQPRYGGPDFVRIAGFPVSPGQLGSQWGWSRIDNRQPGFESPSLWPDSVSDRRRRRLGLWVGCDLALRLCQGGRNERGFREPKSFHHVVDLVYVLAASLIFISTEKCSVLYCGDVGVVRRDRW